MLSDGIVSNPTDLAQTFLENDIISFSCSNSLFAIEDGPTEVMCTGSGMFFPTEIGTCVPVCKF